MIARYFHCQKNLATIREIAGTDREGTNLAGLIKACKALGFDAKAMKGDTESLDAAVPVSLSPIQVKKANMASCYIISLSPRLVKKGSVLDPAKGKVLYSRREFLRKWTGYCVFVSPGSYFKPETSHKNSLLRFLPLLRPYKKTLVLAALASLILIVFGIIGVHYYRYLIDEVVFSKAEFTLVTLSIGMVLIVVFQALLGAIRSMLLSHFSIKADLQLIYFRALLIWFLYFLSSKQKGCQWPVYRTQ